MAFLQILVIDERKGISSFCGKFESDEYLRKYFMSYMHKKRGIHERYVALDVNETEDTLYPVNRDAEGK